MILRATQRCIDAYWYSSLSEETKPVLVAFRSSMIFLKLGANKARPFPFQQTGPLVTRAGAVCRINGLKICFRTCTSYFDLKKFEKLYHLVPGSSPLISASIQKIPIIPIVPNHFNFVTAIWGTLLNAFGAKS